MLFLLTPQECDNNMKIMQPIREERTNERIGAGDIITTFSH